jgi:hypothetical protein
MDMHAAGGLKVTDLCIQANLLRDADAEQDSPIA